MIKFGVHWYLNLAVINMAYCLLGGQSIIHAINEYGCTVVCTRGMRVTSASASTIAMLFPGVLEIGIPIICGFSFSGSSCPNVCCWCSGNDLTRNLLSLKSCWNPFIHDNFNDHNNSVSGIVSSNSVCNHTQSVIILPLRGRPILLITRILQTELDSTQSYYHY